jgi:hypothetical protein
MIFSETLSNNSLFGFIKHKNCCGGGVKLSLKNVKFAASKHNADSAKLPASIPKFAAISNQTNVYQTKKL